MRGCTSVNAFALCLGLFAIVYGSFDTYLISMLTTLERRFSLPSKLSGVLQGSSDFGYLLGVLPISYFGRGSHRPRTLGGLGLLLSGGILAMSLPYFLFGPLRTAGTQPQQLQQPQLQASGGQLLCNASAGNWTPPAERLAANNAAAFGILVAGAFTVGIGSTPFWNLGLAYIDDHVTKVRAPMYISAMMALRFVAPLPGYIVGGHIAELPEDLVGDGDGDGVGAWWVGFVGLSALIAGCSLLMFCFPRRLPQPPESANRLELQTSTRRAGEGEGEGEGVGEGEGEAANGHLLEGEAAKEALQLASVASVASLATLSTGGFAATLRRLFRNATFVSLLIGAAIEFLAFMGFLAFLPKLYQVGFGTSEGAASLYAGLVEGLSSAIGTLAGGVFMNRTTVSLNSLMVITTVLCLVAGGISNVGAVMRCRSTPEFVSLATGASCGSVCGCTDSQFQPVCLGNVSYLSPCLAGCSEVQWNGTTPQFQACGCSSISGSSSGAAAAAAAAAAASSGFCGGPAASCLPVLLLYNCIFFVINFVAGAVKSVMCMIVIRSISSKDKDIGFGFVTFVASFSATVSPLLYGALIDAFCLQRQGGADGLFGHCQLYDVAGIRVSQHLLRGCLRVLCGFAFVAAACSGRSNPHLLANSKQIRNERRRAAEATGAKATARAKAKAKATT